MLSIILVVFMVAQGLVAETPMLSERMSAPVSVKFSCPTKFAPSHLRVFAKPDELFVVGDPNVSGSRYSGFFVDLLEEIQRQTGITYTITPRSDLFFDRPNENGTWDGTLVGALINDEADLVGPLITATPSSEKVIDDLMPIIKYKLQVLVNPLFVLQRGIQYIAMDNADLAYLKNSKNATLQAIYNNIIAGKPDTIVPNDAAGVEKVLSGNFAFITKSFFVEKILTMNGGKLVRAQGDLGTHFLASPAVQLGSPLRDQLNIALLRSMQDGTLQALFEKYGFIHSEDHQIFRQ